MILYNLQAFKTAAKNSWKRRYFVFDVAALSLRYYDKPPAPGATLGRAKGEFVLDPSDMTATFSADHSKLHEIKVASKGNSLYVFPDTFKEGAELIARLDAARRTKVAGMLRSSTGRTSSLRRGPHPPNCSPFQATTAARSCSRAGPRPLLRGARGCRRRASQA